VIIMSKTSHLPFQVLSFSPLMFDLDKKFKKNVQLGIIRDITGLVLVTFWISEFSKGLNSPLFRGIIQSSCGVVRVC